MVRRILLIIAFLGGFVLLDRAIGAAIRAAYDRTFTGEAGGQINEALRNRDRNFMIFGSSLARHQLDPSVLEAQLGLSGFNAGCNGQDIYYARMLQSLLLQRNGRSRHFIYVLNWRDLVHDDVDRARMFAVFADESPTIRRILAPSLVEQVKLQSRAYRFNTLAISTMRQLLAPEYEGIDGFVELPNNYKPIARDSIDMDRDLRDGLSAAERSMMITKLQLYRDFSWAARAQDIAVTFVLSPTYRGGRALGRGERSALVALSEVAEDTDANFIVLDETTVPAFRSVSYYRDARHLNARGAALFSRLLARCLDSNDPHVAKTQRGDNSPRPCAELSLWPDGNISLANHHLHFQSLLLFPLASRLRSSCISSRTAITARPSTR